MVRIGLKQRSLKGAQFFPENFKARKLISIQIPAPTHLYRYVGMFSFGKYILSVTQWLKELTQKRSILYRIII